MARSLIAQLFPYQHLYPYLVFVFVFVFVFESPAHGNIPWMVVLDYYSKSSGPAPHKHPSPPILAHTLPVAVGDCLLSPSHVRQLTWSQEGRGT